MSPYTLTGPARMIAMMRAIEHINANKIPGDIVECGVWKGGSMMLAARTLMRLGDSKRHLHLYDTFEGMSAPTDADVDFRGLRADDDMPNQIEHTLAGLEEVRQNLLGTGYPVDAVHFIEGKVEETIPAHTPERIALLRLDTDWYESTYHELVHLYPLLSPGGIVIIDDYGHWNGARRAVDQFMAEQDPGLFLHRIDYSARLLVKPRFDPRPATSSKPATTCAQ
ncbi:MAG: TylF/MycF/NovP-related O-methyltransferase [Planctomycetota bacterium]